MKQTDIFIEIKEISAFLLQKGWAERNAGNFSFRLNEAEIYNWLNENQEFIFKKHLFLDTEKLSLNYDCAILISNSGSKFRDIAKDPIHYCGIVHFKNNKASFYCTHESANPSSELPTHLLIHNFLLKNNSPDKTIIHTHPTNLIAFSHKFYDYSNTELNNLLESIMPEVSYFVPQKTGFVNLLNPGSSELANATLSELNQHSVIVWKKHGCLAVSDSFWDGLDMIDILDKAAYIALLANLK